MRLASTSRAKAARTRSLSDLENPSEKIAEGARFRPFQQGIRVRVDVDQGSQVTAIIDEAGSRKQLVELLVRGTENRIGFIMPVRNGLYDGLAKQNPGLVRFGRVLNVQSEPAARLEDAVNFRKARSFSAIQWNTLLR